MIRGGTLRTTVSGVVLEKSFPLQDIVESPNLKQVQLKQSGEVVSESEKLVKGNVSNAKATKIGPQK